MSPQNITAISAIIVNAVYPILAGMGIFETYPDALALIMKGLTGIFDGLLVVCLWWASPSTQERVNRVVTAAIAYYDSVGRSWSKVELRGLAVKMIIEQAGEIGGFGGFLLRIPIIGKMLAGSQIDKLASGVKLAVNDPHLAPEAAKEKNAKAR